MILSRHFFEYVMINLIVSIFHIKTSIGTLKIEKIEAANILDAAAQGASIAIMVVLNIGASLVAFLAFVEFINQIISKLSIFFIINCLSTKFSSKTHNMI